MTEVYLDLSHGFTAACRPQQQGADVRVQSHQEQQQQRQQEAVAWFQEQFNAHVPTPASVPRGALRPQEGYIPLEQHLG